MSEGGRAALSSDEDEEEDGSEAGEAGLSGSAGGVSGGDEESVRRAQPGDGTSQQQQKMAAWLSSSMWYSVDPRGGGCTGDTILDGSKSD